ncbi:MAG: hypothetical protein QFX34_02445 [Candidatus Verstraetearchaeota archaeon]|nr:hypothetical protein [Candidatus Verstraetearchaeota archaeon]
MPLTSIKSRFLLLSLSLFYNAAFVDRVWTDPKMRRTLAGVMGTVLIGISAAVYSIDRVFFSTSTSPYSDFGIFLGLVLFLVGAWKGGMVIAFDIERSWAILRAKRTVLCVLDDPMQSSAYIEGILTASQDIKGGNGLKVSEKYLMFAAEIWAESMARKGLIRIERVLENGDLGDLIANKSLMSSM